MKKLTIVKILTLFINFIGSNIQSQALDESKSANHKYQHGFILSGDDKFASHLVANGHHSQQTDIIGELFIEDVQEMELYQERKLKNENKSYFLFQAQMLDLTTISEGQILTGHIVESQIGHYEPKNKIVNYACFKVEKVILNIPNPFFNENQNNFSVQPSQLLQHDNNYLDNLLNIKKNDKKHCCETGKKPCNWKC